MNKSDYIFGIRAIIEESDAGKEIDKVLMRLSNSATNSFSTKRMLVRSRGGMYLWRFASISLSRRSVSSTGRMRSLKYSSLALSRLCGELFEGVGYVSWGEEKKFGTWWP